jgi:TRAP-type C4-dicarboxylate transport system permease small subunit
MPDPVIPSERSASPSDPAPPAEDRVDRVLGMLSAIPLALIVALTFADVFARYLFARPIRGSVEIIQYAMALTIFTALPLVTRHRGHITVSLVDRYLAGGLQRLQAVVCDALSVVALALITWRLWVQGFSDLSGNMSTVVLQLPQAPLSWTMCGFAALSTLVMTWLLWGSLTGASRRTEGQG